MKKIAVYGASGFTGRLVVAELARRGVPVVLVGRDENRLRTAAEGVPRTEVRHAGVENPSALAAAFADCAAVVNCVAPFELFGEPVVRAAIASGSHYVDTNGEQSYLKRVFDTYGDPARQAGICVVPALADDGGPGDLIAHLTAESLHADLAELTIADLRRPGAVSRGTARTALANRKLWSGGPGLVWTDGAWHDGAEHAPGDRATVPVPEGEEGDIKVAPFALPGVITVPRHVRAGRIDAVMREEVVPLFGAVTEELVASLPEGPDPAARRASRWLMAAYAVGRDGSHAQGSVTGTDGYGMTAVIAVEGALRLVADAPPAGVLAPSQAFEPADFLRALEPHGVRWSVDVD
ncbi:saccharopine dehydrogenase family protein [Streptomyces acidiscabies]|uniref:saccharopine dehydrogenase family protein n=1 Tax=Streptomyces acidiscabies TaxID=42234 RepID=UPI00095EB629|nr:saccharopine dehydrogenase NADP-binding domain-containing protein [Streptomyces acidiscabies]GAV43838.1 putative trans-acting enoyl reductase [Streptomyces acidiscabies]